MTVEKLIKELQKFPKDAKVFYIGEYCSGEIDEIFTQTPHDDFDTKDCVVLANKNFM